MASVEPLHIPLNARLALFLRVFSFDLAQIESDFLQNASADPRAEQSLQARKCFGALREGVDHFVAMLFRDFSWREPADVSLHQIRTRLIGELQTLSDLARDGDTDQYISISALEQSLRAIDCNACKIAAGLDRVCQGDPLVDSQLVARKGLCFRWLLDIAEYASTYTRETYAPILDRFGLPAPVASFSTGLRFNPRPHGLSHHAQLAARTEFRDDPAATSAITLFISDKFDLPSWLAVLYVLFHEYVCHAYQALDRSRMTSRDRPADSRFAEGWMDAVAHLLARDQINTPRPDFPLSLLSHRPQLLSEIQSLFEARYASDAPESPSKRLAGVRAFNRVATCFWYNSERGSGTTRESVQFSLALNVGATDDELEQVTTMLMKLLPHNLKLRGYHSRSRAACVVMRRFLESFDIRALIADLLRLVDQLSAI